MAETTGGLLNNKLLLQYLSAAGMDISGGGVLGANVNQVTQQNISAQNYAKLLKNILSKGGKISMDQQNISIKAPSAAFQGPEGPGTASPLGAPQENIGLRGESGTAGVSTGVNKLRKMEATPESRSESDLLSSLLMGNLGIENPSASPLGDISAADLAGLTPQDISQALQFRFAQDEQAQQRINDAFNNAYKAALMGQMESEAIYKENEQVRKLLDSLRTSPLEVPGISGLTLEEWEKLPADVKSYSYYAFDAKKNNEEVLSFNEFKQQSDPSSLIQYYKMGEADPEFKKWLLEYKAAGATQINIGQQVEKKRAMEWVDFETSLPEKLGKHMSSDEVQSKLLQFDPGTTEEVDAIANERARYIESELKNRGTVIDMQLSDDGVATWTIKTKSGTTETITYALYD